MMETAMTEAEFSSRGLGPHAAIIAAFMLRCEALTKITFGGDKYDYGCKTYEPAMMETAMTEADFINRGLGPYAAIIATFMPRCE